MMLSLPPIVNVQLLSIMIALDVGLICGGRSFSLIKTQANAESQPSSIPRSAYTFSVATLIVYAILVPAVLMNTHIFEQWGA